MDQEYQLDPNETALHEALNRLLKILAKKIVSELRKRRVRGSDHKHEPETNLGTDAKSAANRKGSL
ncbi:MAG: hypothetical protein HY040_07475 [Planctomycetes bacterium]|nr:hypothetical protein [Planctomycetota bacterium]